MKIWSGKNVSKKIIDTKCLDISLYWLSFICAIWQQNSINLRVTAIHPHTPNMKQDGWGCGKLKRSCFIYLMELFLSSSVKTFLKRIIAPNSLLPLTVVLKNKTDFLMNQVFVWDFMKRIFSVSNSIQIRFRLKGIV